MTELAILWHFHQPDYRDPDTGRPWMPWTRLHALRGYRDLIVESIEEEVPVTLNLVPVLVDMLEAYAHGMDDPHLELTRVPADALDAAQRGEVLRSFIAGHPAMVDAHPAYALLRDRLRAGTTPTVEDLRDLQVWSTLAWFGATALRDFPELRWMQAKGRRFTESEKTAMLGVQERVLRELPERIRALGADGGPEACTTPYFHPILPLLYDVRHGDRCGQPAPEDVSFHYPEDVRWQLESARTRMERALGHRPVGLWPSEGSVSPEVIAMAAEAGFKWFASDDGVLDRSVRSGGGRPGPWDAGGIVGLFRDHELSDRIGFRYAQWKPDEAVADLMASVEARGEDGVVTLILDGENPWEAFADAGAGFRRHLYDAMRRAPVRGVTLGEAATRPVVGTIETLHTGSWISSDFHIWFGHPSDHAAWRALGEARAAVERSEQRAAGLSCLYPAEGSDWTWWYGEEFDTPFFPLFDGLFRAHLRAAYRAIGQTPPAYLDQPLATSVEHRVESPRGLISPRLDAGIAWARWNGAGRIAVTSGGSMASGRRHLREVHWGVDAGRNVWLGLRPDTDATWRVWVDDEEIVHRDDAPPSGSSMSAVGEEIVVRIAGVGERAGVVLEAIEDDRVVARYPSNGHIELPVDAAWRDAAWWV